MFLIAIVCKLVDLKLPEGYYVDLCYFLERKTIKGTVRPDWISLRVVSLDRPLKGHQPLYVFDFLILILNI